MKLYTALSAVAAFLLMVTQLHAQYGPPPVIGPRAAAADTGGAGSYGDTTDEMVGNGTRTYWGMGRGLTGEGTLGSGTSGYSGMGLAGFGQTTGGAQLIPYYELGGEAAGTNYGTQQYGLGATPGFGRNYLGPGRFGGTTTGYGSAPAWPSSNPGQPQYHNPGAIQPRGLVRVTQSPYAPPGNPGFVDPGVASRANEYTYIPVESAPQTLTAQNAYSPPAQQPQYPQPQQFQQSPLYQQQSPQR